MQYAFQDYDNLYLVMDLLTGGDLRYHISRHKRFSEEQTSIDVIKYFEFFFFKASYVVIVILNTNC